MVSARIGLDIGSTTAKLVLVDEAGKILYSTYRRHHADILGTAVVLFLDVRERFGDPVIRMTITGSAGMGIAERFLLPFEQEVVCATNLIRSVYPDIKTLIDIGGEDAKMVFFSEEALPDMRMSGNCAGGTGAFIDQMATLLGITVDEMGELALQPGTKLHPIASRCGVFSKTDIQNLIARNVSKADVAASVFHAVAVQTVTTLSHGFNVKPKVLFCGGPFAFTPALREAFVCYLDLQEGEYIVPENAPVISAWGAALSADQNGEGIRLSEFIANLDKKELQGNLVQTNRLEPLFENAGELNAWEEEKKAAHIARIPLPECSGECYLGIDSGSTTTKIVAIDQQERIVFSYYANNEGNPIAAAQKGLQQFLSDAEAVGKVIRIKSSCSTGYGEDLLRAAFGLKGGIIETIAHYLAARKVSEDVSFILDIGGQDMKALFVENGALYRVEINEACSSGCGSFISAFAGSLQHTVADFASMACTAEAPCDLGTRCTVFMNSKVKQFLREGASVSDISAGLSYSVVKNCLYKVLKLKNLSELGGHIVVQGGTMRNRSIVRAFEKLTGVPVSFTDIPELMGAYGCALYAKSQQADSKDIALKQILQTTDYTARQTQCKGCENQCYVTRYTFNNGNVYYSGNKCEKIFTNRGADSRPGENIYTQKHDLLFDRTINGSKDKALKIGIPRILGMYEDYPFWHALFGACGFEVVLSAPSTMRNYERGVNSVMSDNICFPAKLAHSHILDLAEQKVDRIFYPFTVYEQRDGKQEANTYNCPVVAGYAEVLKSSMDPEAKYGIPLDSPVITFRDAKSLRQCCVEYLRTLGISDSVVKKAADRALAVQEDYKARLKTMNLRLWERSKRKGRMTVLLAGRPYHTDPLVQHKLSDMIAGFGVDVISEDIVRDNDGVDITQVHSIPQWSYVNRILKAAQWVAEQGDNIHFVQMTSFGCGPDAFLLDEVRAILKRYGKTLTILKIDDVNNIGSLRLRVRSLIESLKFNSRTNEDTTVVQPFLTTKLYTKAERGRKLLLPHFSDSHIEVIEALFRAAGYDAETLPRPDGETVDQGLKYANNEVCYPATLIVGDMIKALQSGKYDLDNVALVITQTGGQCRATNYLTLLKKAVLDAGFPQVPVISLTSGGGLESGLKINWFKVAPVALAALLYGDCMAKFYYAAVVRERTAGEAAQLRKHYLDAATPYILKRNANALFRLMAEAAAAFDGIVVDDIEVPRVGVVGEIYLKLNSFSHKDILNWLAGQGVEVIPPTIINFFMQAFVNRKVNKAAHLTGSSLIPEFVMDRLYKWADNYVERANLVCGGFRYFVPFENIFEEAEKASEMMTLAAQFGEGWLIPAEMVGFAREGVNNVVSLQPFGCIANHIISKGIEKKIRDTFPQMNLLFLDFDSGVSEVNVLNRLHLMVNNLKQQPMAERRHQEKASV